MKSHFANIAPCLAIGCIVAVLCVLPGCSEPENREFTTRPVDHVIMLQPIKGTSKKTSAGTQVTFYFRNGTDQPVNLPGRHGASPTDGTFRPAFVRYEVRVGDDWQRLNVKYDGLGQDYVVTPGTDLRLLIGLGAFEKYGVAKTTPVRVKLHDMPSDQFTLEEVSP